ncbi:MAG: NifU family protein [Bacteriovoracaceae bacterium]|nr:NifU family protein [Bacteriovoracaceae bacterium]
MNMKEKIEILMNEEVRPSLASHGGNVEVVDVKDNKVMLKLTGGCQGCAGARMTLKNGVERIIKAKYPEIEEVVDVTDHGGGDKPYM